MSSHLEPLIEVNKVTDISNKKALIKMKNFLTLNSVDVSSDAIQETSIGAVSDELLEKIEKVTQAIETEKVLCKPVPPVVLAASTEDSVAVVAVSDSVEKAPKTPKRKKRESTSTPATKEKKKRAKTE